MSAGRILITGAGGQVGNCLARRAAGRGQPVLALRHEDLDVSSAAQVDAAVEAARPAVVINCAAYTDVDGAEDHERQARRVNALGAGNLAAACSRTGSPLIQISTDYVFDGQRARPYREDDRVNPINVYGRTKWEGEEAVRGALERHLIVRTSWVFAAGRQNFVTTILHLARSREVLRVVADQVGSPTPAEVLAERLYQLALSAANGKAVAWGTYHLAGEPPVSRHELAIAVVRAAAEAGEVACTRIEPVASSEFPTPAPRPANSALDSSRTRAVLGLEPISWQPALAAVAHDGG